MRLCGSVHLPERSPQTPHNRRPAAEELGYELRRPKADYLRDDVYELQVRFRHLNYRVLYFFYGLFRPEE